MLLISPIRSFEVAKIYYLLDSHSFLWVDKTRAITYLFVRGF